MEGPLKPLWVNNIPSSKIVLLKETIAAKDNPLSSLHIISIFSLKVRGTKAGNVSITFKLNFLAISYPNLLAPILGTDKPPVAITNDSQEYFSELTSIKY